MQTNYESIFYKILNIFTNETFLATFLSDIISFIFKLILGILFFFLGHKLLKKILNKYYNTPHFNSINLSLKTFLSSIINTGSILFLISLTLIIMGFNHASLIALLGSIGIGVGLALKDNLSNFVGGLIILVFKTYSVGDEVNINSNLGIVSSIDMFSTSIRSFDGDIVTIPNANVVNDQVINYSKTPTRRIKIIVSVPLDTDVDYAFEVLKKLLEKNENILKNPPPFINIDRYTPFSIQIAIKGWTTNSNYWSTYFDIQKKIKSHLDSFNISMPQPKLDINLKRNK